MPPFFGPRAISVTHHEWGGGVKLPGDSLTLELPGLGMRRGRGRPRKQDALTPAQRAQRYRDKLKADPRRAAQLADERAEKAWELVPRGA